MSDAQNPTGPSQPTAKQAYETPGNPTSKEPSERAQTNANAQSDAPPVEQRSRKEQSIDDATPSSMGRGVRGAPPGEETKGYTQDSLNREQELDGEQMAAPGEGKVSAANYNKPGASGNEPGLENDLEKKKAEQAPARQKVQEEEQQDVDVAGVLGQRGGPANPVS